MRHTALRPGDRRVLPVLPGPSRRRVGSPLLYRLPHGLCSRRIARELSSRRLQLSRRKASTLQDRVATRSALCRVHARRILHALEVGHDRHERGVAHSGREFRAAAARGRPEPYENDQERMSGDERRFHEAARLSDDPECVKRT